MAKPATETADPFKALSEEANERLTACEAQKTEFDLDIREAYFFTATHRARELRSAQPLSASKPKDADELQSGIGSELSKDFVTVIVNAFMPQSEPWAEQRPGMFIPRQHVDEVKKQIAVQDPLIFNAIRASNLYEEVPKAFNPDLPIGTAALLVDDPRPAENIVVQAIPLHELEINLGPYGHIDDRFVVRHTKNRHVKALLGETIFEKLSSECKKRIGDKPAGKTIIRWGFWRRWDLLEDVVWQHVVMLDKKVIFEKQLVGEGSCPLIPMRFNPSPEWAFGIGPVIESLPDFREYDELKKKKLEHVDLSIAPPSTYPDDSFTPIEEGVESGKIYPIRPGSENAVQTIFEAGTMEPAIYETSEIERTLRHRFYLDWPQQRGDTPPTATQWLDEMQLAQRRLGTPGSSFWREGPAEIFLRFKHILKTRGIIDPIVVDGKTVSLEPYNPAQRAAEQQEIAMFARFAQLMAPLFPEEWKLRTDGQKTMQAVGEKMRVTGLWKERSEADQKAALSVISELSQGRQQVRPADASIVGSQ